MAVVYDAQRCERDEEKIPLLNVEKGRPNGSLYSRQKRQIADACEWLRLTQRRDQKAVIFCLTSPGFTSLANTPKFISRFVENMKANYGMGDYVWVREHTKAGYPHFHFVAHWHLSKWFLVPHDEGDEPMVTKISRYWSSQFGSDALNSVRFGSYNPKTQNRTFYLSTSRHAWYLTKYLGKSIGDGSMDYLAEAGFPSVVYKKSVRGFGMSENVALLSQPDLFESQHLTISSSEAVTAHGQSVIVETKQRVFVARDLSILSESDLTAYDWRWTGHGETYIGFVKR
jgi:hypothetical protein